MDIEELVKKYAGEWGEYTQMAVESSIRAALTELAAEHALEMRAQDATIANLQERVRQLEAERVPEGWQLVPTVPTQGMAEAYWLAYDECSEGSHLGICYAAMLAAAPQQQKEPRHD